MNLISFFSLKLKPRLTRGKGMWNPLETQSFSGFFAIRDRDVNCFLFPAAGGYIAFDSGYPGGRAVRAALARFGIPPEEVQAVFLTHLDLDHAGGVSDGPEETLFPRAEIYLGREEEHYLSGEYCRKQLGPYRCKYPLRLPGHKLVRDGQSFRFGGVTVEAIHTPGHTRGHMAYLVNETWLLTGDSLVANERGGYAFYDAFNCDPHQNLLSLTRLHKLCAARRIESVLTSHSGLLPAGHAFRHYTLSPRWQRRGFCFCKDAPYDAFDENPPAPDD